MLHFDTTEGPLAVSLTRLVVAGWTGRDDAAVRHHIEELAEIGVPRPSRVPLFYEVSPLLAVQSDRISVLGKETSGEAEPFILRAGGRLWLGLGSDHTDRWLETTSVAHSKQGCPKPVAKDLWPMDGVADHLDELTLSASIDDGTLYQQGTLEQILPLPNLVESAGLRDGEAMLCGTLPAIGGVRPASHYEMELARKDGRAIGLSYDVETLPVVS